MIVLFTVLSIMLWFAFASLEGYLESYHWHYKINTRQFIYSKFKNFDIHPLFTLQRGVVFLILTISLSLNFQLLPLILFSLSNLLVFSFLRRTEQESPPLQWWDELFLVLIQIYEKYIKNARTF